MKKFLSLLLALVLSLPLAVPALAAEPDQAEEAAWSLYHMGLFLGTGSDVQGFPQFSLDRSPTRAQGVTMLVRLIGKEAEAQETPWTAPFQDVPDWAKPYVGYAYANGLTNGRSEIRFDPDTPISASEYLTFVLRALGYDSQTDFAWDSAWTLSDRLGFTDGSYNAGTRSFTRGDVAVISAAALDAKEKGSDRTLRESLAALGIRDNTIRCLWLEEVQTCQPGVLYLSFAPVEESPETYTRFQVNSVTANGVACGISAYATPGDVTAFCQTLAKTEGIRLELPGAFALVRLAYDEEVVKAAATETVTVGGYQYPVISFKFNCTGFLADGTQVEELFILDYYINGYEGSLP